MKVMVKEVTFELCFFSEPKITMSVQVTTLLNARLDGLSLMGFLMSFTLGVKVNRNRMCWIQMFPGGDRGRLM